MKSFTSILIVALLGVANVQAAPVEDVHTIDRRRPFVCPAQVQQYCSASNIDSGCTSGGRFKSKAMDTCGDCRC